MCISFKPIEGSNISDLERRAFRSGFFLAVASTMIVTIVMRMHGYGPITVLYAMGSGISGLGIGYGGVIGIQKMLECCKRQIHNMIAKNAIQKRTSSPL